LAPDAVSVGVEGHTLAGDGFVEIGEAVEVPVDDRLVEVDPQRLSGLELRGIGRQVDETDPLRNGETRRAVPAGVVEHEQDDAVSPGAGLSWAKSASTSSKSRLDTPVDRYQKLSPVLGETKAVT